MKTLAAMAAFLLLTSCGTMFGQNGGDMMITSEPTGARIALDGANLGRTPQQIHVKQSAKGRVTVTLEGYAAMTRKISTTFNGPVLLNVFLGYLGLVGIGIDAMSGNVTNWDESTMHFSLQKEGK